jgi:DNA-binding transcriptional MerR regulator
MDGRLFSTGEVAETLACSSTYVKLLAQELGLRPIRLGSGNLVWTEADLERVRRLRERRRRDSEAAV